MATQRYHVLIYGTCKCYLAVKRIFVDMTELRILTCEINLDYLGGP